MNLFFDGLGLRFLVPQSTIEELSFIEYLNDFVGGVLQYTNKGMTGYPLHARIEGGFGVIVVRYGSSRIGMNLHAEAKGAGAELIRSFCLLNPNYLWVCTRADIACDFVVPDCKLDMRRFKKSSFKPKDKTDGYWQVYEQLWEMAQQKNIATEPMGDWQRAEKGRTYYLGARQSVCRFRFYEKSEEQWAKGISNFPPNILRFEWQYRPEGLHRDSIVELEPHSIIAQNKTAISLFGLVANCNIKYVSVGQIEKSTDEAVFAVMIRQYKNVLCRLIEKNGFRWVLRTAISYLRKEEAQT